jgi:hypothetical protein
MTSRNSQNQFTTIAPDVNEPPFWFELAESCEPDLFDVIRTIHGRTGRITGAGLRCGKLVYFFTSVYRMQSGAFVDTGKRGWCWASEVAMVYA